MPNLTLKNIPDDLYDCLKEAASQHHRSLNSELIACLEQTFRPTRWTSKQYLDKAKSLRSQMKASRIRLKEIDEFKNEGRS